MATLMQRLPIGQRVLYLMNEEQTYGTIIAHHPEGEVVAWDDGFIDTKDDGNVYSYTEIVGVEEHDHRTTA